MRLTRFPGNPILAKNPENNWEAGSVLNPSVIFDDGIYRMVYRATNNVKPDKKGGYVSSIGYAESKDGIHFTRSPEPIISPDRDYENSLGCEDPRLTKIDGTYFLYYTAVCGDKPNHKVRIALATSRDFKTWKKHGVVGPNYTKSKAACLFPEKINGKFVVFYTWMADSPLSSIVQAKFNRLKDLTNPPAGFMADNIDRYQENVVFRPLLNSFRGPEVGAVPIKTKKGWLFIFCGANTTKKPEWTISAALLDAKDPQKVLSMTKKPILTPRLKNEIHGVVNNVVFPEGALIVGDNLYVYYGSGDQGICLATCKLKELINYLSF